MINHCFRLPKDPNRSIALFQVMPQICFSEINATLEAPRGNPKIVQDTRLVLDGPSSSKLRSLIQVDTEDVLVEAELMSRLIADNYLPSQFVVTGVSNRDDPLTYFVARFLITKFLTRAYAGAVRFEFLADARTSFASCLFRFGATTKTRAVPADKTFRLFTLFDESRTEDFANFLQQCARYGCVELQPFGSEA